MNPTNDPNQTDQTNDPRPLAFCQNCGKPLHHDTVRVVGPAVYCEPCLAARLAGASGPIPGPASGIPGTSAGYTPVNAGAPGPNASWAIPPAAAVPNPGLAALLGLIPGVGAMYNEQYAKGLVHLIIFAVLVSFTNISGIFGLFVMGWIFYMAIEAHHTAKARRDGLPLPNPFGLNDIGERMGFGRSWPTGGVDVGGAARDAAQAAGFQPSGFQPAPAAPAWGAPAESYAYAAPPYAAPYTPVAAAPYVPPPVVIPPSRFPLGAVWLIGLGTLFLLGTTGIFNGIRSEACVGFVLLGLGIWIFLRRMTDTGLGLASDGSPAYQFRLVRALRPAAFLILIGLLSLLNTFHIARWKFTWPWIIILVGVLTLLNRLVSNAVLYPAVPHESDLHESAPHESDPSVASSSQPFTATSDRPQTSDRNDPSDRTGAN